MPTLLHHQKTIIEFLNWCQKEPEIITQCNMLGQVGPNLYNEIETNGTIVIQDELLKKLNQINCSTKLSNSGMSKERRIVPDAIKSIMSHPNYWFKFVISNEQDIEEFIRDYVIPFNIPPERVIMMPGLDNRDNFHERTRFDCVSFNRANVDRFE